MAIEHRKVSQVPVCSSGINELNMKLQDINQMVMEKEEISVMFAKMNKEVHERQISLQQEMDHLNNVQESINHMHKRFTLSSQKNAFSVPNFNECDNESEESWNFDSTGVPFQCVHCIEDRRIWYETCNQKTELTCGI